MPVPWIQLTADDIKTRLSGPELDALSGYALADGQADPLPDVISQVTDEARGYIAARAGNVLGQPGTLPAQVRGAVIAIVRWRLAGRLAIGGAEKLLRSETRQAEYQDAVQFLKDIAAGKIKVDQPVNAADISDETMESPEGKFGSNDPINFNV